METDVEMDLVKDELEPMGEEEEVIEDCPLDKTEKNRRLLLAAEDVMKGTSIRNAARNHLVAFSILHDFIKQKESPSTTPGPRPWLSDENEADISNWCLGMSRIGCPFTGNDLALAVQDILNQKKKKVFPNDNLPTSGWVTRFLRIHPELSNSIPEHLGHTQEVSYDFIMQFFADMKEYFENEGINVETFLTVENSSRIFNCDESGFFINANEKFSRVVVVKKGTRAFSKLGGEGKDLVTVLFCGSADGSYVKPLILNKGKSPTPYAKHQGINDDGYSVGFSDSGWMTAKLFYSWISNQFHKELKERNIQRPVVLFLDGYANHINLQTLNFARDNGIMMYCLPPLASHIIQPLDVGLFKGLKESYRETMRNCRGTFTVHNLPKKHFPYVFLSTLEQCNVKENIISGFRASGLVPFNPQVIRRDHCIEFSLADPQQATRLEMPFDDNTTTNHNEVSLSDAYMEGFKAGYEKAKKDSLVRHEAYMSKDVLDAFNANLDIGDTSVKYEESYYMWREHKNWRLGSLPKITPFDGKPIPSGSEVQSTTSGNACISLNKSPRQSTIASSTPLVLVNISQPSPLIASTLPSTSISSLPLVAEDKAEKKRRLLLAAEDVKKGTSIRQAAKNHLVAFATLKDFIKQKDSPGPTLGGSRPWLTDEDEADISTLSLDMSRNGYILTRKAFALVVQDFLNKKKKKKVFLNDNLPTTGWVRRFLRRHPEISVLLELPS